MVLVTHDLSLLEDFERVLVFDEGRLVADDVPAAALPFLRPDLRMTLRPLPAQAVRPCTASVRGWKVLALVVGGTGIFSSRARPARRPALAAVVALYAVARIPWRRLLGQIRPLAWLFAVFFLVQWALAGWQEGVTVVLRFAALVLLASLVTLTTPTSASDRRGRARPGAACPGRREACESQHGACRWRSAFLPVIAAIVAEVRDAQRARGLDRSMIALAVPVIVRTLKTADSVAEALDARGWDPDGDGR